MKLRCLSLAILLAGLTIPWVATAADDIKSLNKKFTDFRSKSINTYELSCVYSDRRGDEEYFISVSTYFNIGAYIKETSVSIDNIHLGRQFAMQHCYMIWLGKINTDTKNYIEYLYEVTTKQLGAESLMLYDKKNKALLDEHMREVDQLKGHLTELHDLLQQSKRIASDTKTAP